MVKKFGKGGIIALSLHPLSRERARGKKVKRGDWKKVWKKSLKNLENEKQALPLQPLSRGGHEGMTGATRWKKEFFKILRWTKRSERESESTLVEIRGTHDPARENFCKIILVWRVWSWLRMNATFCSSQYLKELFISCFSLTRFKSESGCKDKTFFRYLPNLFQSFFKLFLKSLVIRYFELLKQKKDCLISISTFQELYKKPPF